MENINIKTWDSMYSEGRSLLIWPDEIVVSSLNKNRSMISKGLDLGCGAGRHTLLMAQMGIESIGVDSSKSAVEFAKKRAKNLKLNNVKFINCVVQDIALEEESFDIVIAWGLMHYLDSEDQKILLDKVKSLLKSDGLFLCTLRSDEDSRKDNGQNIQDNKYLVDYFDEGTEKVKKTIMYFWNEKGVRELLKDFSYIKLGHRIVEPIGKLNFKTAHWLIEAFK